MKEILENLSFMGTENEIYSSSGFTLEEIVQHRVELEEAYSDIDKDRSINLLKYRQTERDLFLSHDAKCGTCKKSKKLSSFYNREDGTISFDCNPCRTNKEVYKIIADLIKNKEISL